MKKTNVAKEKVQPKQSFLEVCIDATFSHPSIKDNDVSDFFQFRMSFTFKSLDNFNENKSKIAFNVIFHGNCENLFDLYQLIS